MLESYRYLEGAAQNLRAVIPDLEELTDTEKDDTRYDVLCEVLERVSLAYDAIEIVAKGTRDLAAAICWKGGEP